MIGILALCSGETFTSSLSWAEFHAVFSWLGTAGLLFGVSHLAVWGWVLHKHRPNPETWAAGVFVRIYENEYCVNLVVYNLLTYKRI